MGFLYIVTTFTIVTVMMIILSKNKRKRSQDFRSAAWSMGFHYRGEEALPDDLHTILPDFLSGRPQHIIVGRRQQLQFQLFEARSPYGTRGPLRKTAVLALNLTQSNIDLPRFMLRPHRATDSVKQWLGFHTVAVPAPYDKQFTLLNFDDKTIWERQLAQIPAAFYQWLPRHTYLISNGRWLLTFKPNHRLTPTEKNIRAFLHKGIDTYHALHNALNP